MAVNFGLLQPAQPVSAFFQGQQDIRAEADRNALRQMQTEKLQFERENALAAAEERRRATAAQNALAAYSQSGQPMTPEALARFGAPGLALSKSLREERAGQIEQELKVLDYASRRLAAAAPETYGAIRADLNRINPQFGASLPQEFNPEQVMALARQGMSLKDQIESATRQTVVAPGATVLQGGKPIYTAPAAEKPYEPTEVEKLTNALRNAPPGSPEAQALQARIRILTTREPKEPKEPAVQPPIAVVDDATGRVKYVTREEALGKTPAAAIEGLTPKERQQREAKFPQATSAVKTFETTSNTLIKDLETLAKHPGLSSITGIAAGRMPGITSAGREAEALFDKIVARGGFQELQNMRQASPTGGALGNVSNQEGAQLRQAFAALDRRQDAASVRKAITDAINQIRTSQQTIKDAYDMTYEYRQGGGAAPAPAPASPNIDALLNKYK